MKKTRTKPLIILSCVACGAPMPRAVARGLLFGNRQVILQSGFTQECMTCGHLHAPGTRMNYTIKDLI